jgi:hypothetical protein
MADPPLHPDRRQHSGKNIAILAHSCQIKKEASGFEGSLKILNSISTGEQNKNAFGKVEVTYHARRRPYL